MISKVLINFFGLMEEKSLNKVMERNLMKPTPTNYKKWAFKLLIYLIIINITVAYLVFNYAVGIHDAGRFQQNIMILALVGNIILIVGTVLTILSIKNKEEKNYQYYASVIGYGLFIILTVLFLL